MMAGVGQVPIPPNPLHHQHNLFNVPTTQAPLFGDQLMAGLPATDAHNNGVMGTAAGFGANGLVNGTGYRAQTHSMSNGLTASTDAGNQIALRNRYNQSVMLRNPQYQFGAQPLHTDHNSLSLSNGDPTAGVGGSMMTGMVDEQAELAARIRKMKGKKANIPPFVQKLSQ